MEMRRLSPMTIEKVEVTLKVKFNLTFRYDLERNLRIFMATNVWKIYSTTLMLPHLFDYTNSKFLFLHILFQTR